jgi:hypothetical protein
MILDKLHENRERIAQAGLIALARAKTTGSPVYYRDADLGDGIVKEMPDGRRFLVTIDNGSERVTAEFGPRE